MDYTDDAHPVEPPTFALDRIAARVGTVRGFPVLPALPRRGRVGRPPRRNAIGARLHTRARVPGMD